MRALGGLLGQWLVLMLAWLVFVFEFKTGELIVGAAASAVGVFILRIALRCLSLCFEPKLRWLAEAWRLPAMIAGDLRVLAGSLRRDLARKPSRGRFQLGEFPATGADCSTAAQRALAALYVSIPPNSYVLDIDRESGSIFIHQLEPAPFPDMARKLLG